MTTYADAVTASNDDAVASDNPATYAAVPGEPTLTVGGAVWYLVQQSSEAATSRWWVRVLPEAYMGFRTAGGYEEGDLASVIADS